MIKSPFLLFLLLIGGSLIKAQTTTNYQFAYGSFLGGSDFEQARDLAVDRDGNIYITGGTQSEDFPTTPGAYNTIFNNAGSATVGNAGPMMVFVSKFSPDGELIWSTFLGGPNYDRAYAIEVDSAGYVYVGGRAGANFPTTPGAFQETFSQAGAINNLYGHQNGFISKLSPDGSELIWSTYYGSDSFGFFRDFDIDDEGYVYGILNAVKTLPLGISPDAFDTTLNGNYDMVAVKFNQDVTAVEWATVLGGSGEDRGGPAIRVGPDKSVYVSGSTRSSNFPTSPNAIQTQRNGDSDIFVTRITPDGTSLIYSTYFGGNGMEYSETHILVVDHLGQAYVACGTTSTDIQTTPNAIKSAKPDISEHDALCFKLSVTGDSLLACTYLGGTNNDGPEGLFVDSLQNLYVGGGTSSTDFPLTMDAYQSQKNGGSDGYVVKLNSDFSELLYSTYIGGGADEAVRAFNVKRDGSIGISGQTISENLPVTADAFQAAHGTPVNQADAYLIIFEAETLSSINTLNDQEGLKVFPNPASYQFQIATDEVAIEKVELFDSLGQLLYALKGINSKKIELDATNLNPGLYYLKIELSNKQQLTKKIIVAPK